MKPAGSPPPYGIRNGDLPSAYTNNWFATQKTAVIACLSMKRRLLFLSFLVLSFSLSLCAQNATKPDLIQVGDTLSIEVFNQPDFTVRVIVRSDGKISLPLLNNVPADGLTVSELRQILVGRYTKYIKEPVVEVRVR